jgi:glycosyltransferase involved in cell wall biosynthesis
MSDLPLRVLHLHTGNIMGGVESILLSLVRHSPLAPDLKMDFALCHEGFFARDLVDAGARVRGLRPVSYGRPWTVPLVRRAAYRLMDEIAPDACVMHSTWTQAVFGPACRRAGVPQALWMHSPIPGRGWIQLLARLNPPDALLCVSEDVRQRRQGLYRRVPAEVIYTPLPHRSVHATVAPRARTRAELGIADDQAVIVQVSRLERWKGHIVMLDALAGLRARRDWVCLLVGGMDRPEEQAYLGEIRSRIAAAGIQDRVRFLGRRADVPSLLAASDIYCQPNLDTEGFSIAFLEACLASLPIVTSDIGSAREIVTEENGVLLPVGDVEALGKALAALLEAPGRRLSLGTVGLAKAWKLCDPKTQMPALRDFFLRLAATREED